MDIQNAIYTQDGTINVTVDGVQLFIPAIPGNRHYAELVRQGITPALYVAPVPTYSEKRQTSIADGGYGTWQEQLEILGEQGIGAFQQHIAAVKAAHPKPT